MREHELLHGVGRRLLQGALAPATAAAAFGHG